MEKSALTIDLMFEVLS